jgi:hypothetical protein
VALVAGVVTSFVLAVDGFAVFRGHAAFTLIAGLILFLRRDA